NDGANLTTEYTYDANGNMLTDANKGISSNIQYNHLNLPTSVSINGNGNSGTISYIYDATGVKLEKKVTEGISNTYTYYAGNYIYDNNGLKFFSHPEGYIEPDGTGFNYVYQYKDHLGNIRLAYSDSDHNGTINASTEIIEENNYYPFGLKHKGYNNVVNGASYKYKTYQGQEFHDELGLNIHEWKYRISDPSIGRFWQIDPLAEDYVYNGTYNFAENRVIDGNELEGLEWVDAKGNKVYDPSVVNEDGTRGAYTEHAGNSHRNLGRFLSQTKTGKSQFSKLVNSEKPIQTIMNNGKDVVLDSDGALVLGKTTNTFDEKTEYDFGTGKSTVTGADVKSSIITFNMASIDEAIELLKSDTNSEHAYFGLSVSEMLGAIFGHELVHTTSENQTLKVLGEDHETPAYEVGDQIAKEVKEENKKDDD
ncbi:RHS repeat domain-containing protein, partial [Winogradskyella haliclonae]|uniref:RHS repeat domain-containing protein n=1 Tax=Winogradskyella haliclonae TaxID=2048558 RepID=UPI003530DBE1